MQRGIQARRLLHARAMIKTRTTGFSIGTSYIIVCHVLFVIVPAIRLPLMASTGHVTTKTMLRAWREINLLIHVNIMMMNPGGKPAVNG